MTAAHSELVARLEGASEGSRELDREVHFTAFPDVAARAIDVQGWFWSELISRDEVRDVTVKRCMTSDGNYTTSLDAALALAERMLPGWRRHLNELPPSTGLGWEATVWTDAADLSVHPTRAPTPALAMCIAVLRAKEPDGEKT